MRPKLDIQTFRELKSEIGATNAEVAAELGVSEISIKRLSTGAQVITDQMARQLVARVLIQREGLHKKFNRLLNKYHSENPGD